MAHVDALFKMIAIGDEGPVRTKLVEHLAYDSFSDEYAQTIGARIHVIRRSVSNIAVKIVLWEVFNNIGQLKQSYYQNTSMVIMTVSDSSQDACTRYQDLLTEVYEVVGKIPVALVVDEADPLYDADFIEKLAQILDVSQVIKDLNNLAQLENKIDRLIREYLFVSGMTKEPYILSLFRVYGVLDVLDNEEKIIKVIRQIDTPTEISELLSSDVVHRHFDRKGTSLFVDIEHLKKTEYSVHIPKILERRAQEIKKIWINITPSGNYDLRYLWLTAYGFEILRSMKMPLMVKESDFRKIKRVFGDLGFELQVRSNDKYPDMAISPELRDFVWSLVPRL